MREVVAGAVCGAVAAAVFTILPKATKPALASLAAGAAVTATLVAFRRRKAASGGEQQQKTKQQKTKKKEEAAAVEFKIRPGDGKSLGVGVCVFILSRKHPGCVLLGVRRGSDGAGTYALPGGHLEFGESPLTCAARETEEETGLKVTDLRCVGFCNAVEPQEDYHYVTLACVCWTDGEPINMEPNKCDGWIWQPWDAPDFPAPLFSGLRKIRASGFDPTVEPTPALVFVE